MKNRYKIICGDCLEIVPELPRAKLIWADPPDNIGVEYADYYDDLIVTKYVNWLQKVVSIGVSRCSLFWLSYNVIWQPDVLNIVKSWPTLTCPLSYRQFVWHYTFGQNRRTDFVQSFRPIIRCIKEGTKTYPKAVYIPSARQTKYKDKRANAGGKMPDDVWEFPRVCGTFHERKRWHPCQHPKELLRRIVRFSTKPNDLVIDMFAGSGNMIEVCEEEGRNCIGIEISKTYCDHIKEDMKKRRIELR